MPRRLMASLRICLAILLLSAIPGEAATYYVSQSGSDANSCATATSTTQSNQKLTISAGVACLAAGDTLYIHTGTYTGTTNRIDSQDYSVASGTNLLTGAITISAYPSETVTIQPPDNKACVRAATNQVSYVIVQNLICDMVNSTVFGGTTESGIAISAGSHHIRFVNIEVKNNTGDGVGFSHNNGGSNNIQYIGGSVHNFGDCSGSNPNTGYGFYISSNDNLVEGVDIYASCGYGIHVYTGGLNDANNNVIRKNRIHANGGGGGTNFGITIGDGDNNQVYNNLIYANTGSAGTGGIRVYSDCTNCLVAYNSIYGNNAYGVELQYYGTGVVVRDNIVYNNSGGTICDYGGGGTCSSGTATIDTNLTTNPSFTSPSTGDFTITISSAAHDIGVAITGITSDFIGTSRPQGSLPDVGAYEVDESGDTPDPCAPPIVSGSWTLIACPGASGATATSDATTNARDTTGADFAVCGVASDKTGVGPTFTDSKSNSWTLLDTVTYTYGRIQLYRSRLTSVGTNHTFTVGNGGSAYYSAVQCTVWSGSRSSPDDGLSAGAFATGLSVAAGSLTRAQTKELVVTVATPESTYTLSAGGFTVYQRTLVSGASFGVGLGWATYTPTGAINPTWTWPTSMDVSATAASFFAADSATGTQRFRIRRR